MLAWWRVLRLRAARFAQDDGRKMLGQRRRPIQGSLRYALCASVEMTGLAVGEAGFARSDWFRGGVAERKARAHAESFGLDGVVRGRISQGLKPDGVDCLMSGLKPGPISGATAKARGWRSRFRPFGLVQGRGGRKKGKGSCGELWPRWSGEGKAYPRG